MSEPVVTLQVLPGGGHPTSVITLTERRQQWDQNHCEHYPLIVDECLNSVACGDCGMLLNPVAMLMRCAREETRLMREREAATAYLVALEAKQRTKCQHCGKLTRVHT